MLNKKILDRKIIFRKLNGSFNGSFTGRVVDYEDDYIRVQISKNAVINVYNFEIQKICVEIGKKSYWANYSTWEKYGDMSYELYLRYREGEYMNELYNKNDIKAVENAYRSMKITPKKVIFNGPATIVIWEDGEKTVVKCREGETYDKEKAVMYAILKRLCCGKASMDRYLKLFLKEESNEEKKEETGSSELH